MKLLAILFWFIIGILFTIYLFYDPSHRASYLQWSWSLDSRRSECLSLKDKQIDTSNSSWNVIFCIDQDNGEIYK